MLENHSTPTATESADIQTSSKTAQKASPFNPIETAINEEAIALERVSIVLKQLEANEDNDQLSPVFSLLIEELERTTRYREQAIAHSRELTRAIQQQSLNALSPKPQDALTSKEIEALFLDLTLIRVNCISADKWIEDFYHRLKDIGGSADLRAGDIALLSAKAAELALKWANRITEGSV